MSTQTYDFDLNQGDTFQMVLRLVDPETGAPVDYTGASAASQLRVAYDDASPAGAFTCAFSDAPGGVLTLSMTAAQTAALDFNKAFYDVEVTDGAGVTQKVLRGRVTLVKEATK